MLTKRKYSCFIIAPGWNAIADFKYLYLALVKYIAEEDKFEKLLENQQILLTPIVRNGKQVT